MDYQGGGPDIKKPGEKPKETSIFRYRLTKNITLCSNSTLLHHYHRIRKIYPWVGLQSMLLVIPDIIADSEFTDCRSSQTPTKKNLIPETWHFRDHGQLRV